MSDTEKICPECEAPIMETHIVDDVADPFLGAIVYRCYNCGSVSNVEDLIEKKIDDDEDDEDDFE